ncbi:MAG: hypothetical protein M1147_03345 [Nitrospirae bacterium]|nr:hypothetical protein [Nitrospirota bacterium]MCL5977151.1 hypothetical protein [Nitrospirota bacterium]
MVTGKEDLLQALIKAYIVEKGTMEFYSYASENALNPEAKKMFGNLSGWEERHMEYIRFLYHSVTQDLDLKGFEEFSKMTDAPFTEAGIPVKDMETRFEEHKFIDDMGALIMALEVDGKAYALYSRLSKSAADANARVVFHEMMGQEAKHIEYLKKLRIKLSET